MEEGEEQEGKGGRKKDYRGQQEGKGGKICESGRSSSALRTLKNSIMVITITVIATVIIFIIIVSVVSITDAVIIVVIVILLAIIIGTIGYDIAMNMGLTRTHYAPGLENMSQIG